MKGVRDSTPYAVFFLVVAVFSFLPPAIFLQWDDAANLVSNSRWRGASFENLKWMLTTRHYGPWQPLSWLSWALDGEAWGLNPEAFRRTNVLLHAATAASIAGWGRVPQPRKCSMRRFSSAPLTTSCPPAKAREVVTRPRRCCA